MPDAVLPVYPPPLPTAPTVFQYPDGWMEFVPVPGGFLVGLRPSGSATREDILTWFPPDVVRGIAATHGFARTAEVIARHQDPPHLEHILQHQLFSYFTPAQFAGKRILDFGCGTGPSTFCLARLLPDSEVIGVDFDPARLALAQRIADLSDLPNASFRQSPSPFGLPTELGPVDFVVMSASYQHMLPQERRTLMPLLWRLLSSGGALLISQTSHRWRPLEPDMSGLYFINYLPLGVAAFLARHFSSRDEDANRERDLTGLLRAGLRGGAEREVLDLLPANTVLLRPVVQPDRAAYWKSGGRPAGLGIARALASKVFRWTDRRWGVVPSRHLDMVIRKHG